MTRVVYLIETPNAGWDQPYRIGDKREMGAEPWVPKADMDRLREALVAAQNGLSWALTHLSDRGMSSLNVNVAAKTVDAALAALPDADDEGDG